MDIEVNKGAGVNEGMTPVFDLSDKKLPNLKNLKMKTMGETYKHLNQLLKGKSFQDFENIAELTSASNLSMFEESLRLVIIDSLQLENEVVKILLSQNDYQIKRILKCNWFFKKPLSAEYYITQIIPNISASLRYKIVTKLSKYLTNETEAEALFKFLQCKYSVSLAEKLLPNCSKKFISEYIGEIKKLSGQSSRIILNISKKCPEIGMKILSNLIGVLGYHYYDYKQAIIYLALNYTNIFISFIEKYHSKMRFGRDLQLKLKQCPLKPHEVMHSKVYNKRYLFKSLSYEDKVKFLSGLITPSDKLFMNWETCMDDMTFLLKVVQPSDRLGLIENVFKKVHNSNYCDNPEAWSLKMLALIPNKQRQPFVEKLDKAVNKTEPTQNIQYMSKEPETYIYLYDFSIAFERLKKIISKSPSPYRRQVILNHMVECCAINRDLIGLEVLLDYVKERQRNSDPRILSEFLSTVVRSFPKTEFNLETWEKLQAIAQICALKNHTDVYAEITERHILHRIEMKASVESYYKNFFDLYVLKCVYSESFLYSCKSENSRTLFLAICREILNWIRMNPSEINVAENLLTNILNTCKKFNKFNKKKLVRLEEIPWMDEELEKQLKKHFGELGFESRSPDIWGRFYAAVMDPDSKARVLSYVLKQSSEMKSKNVEGLVNHLLFDTNEKAEYCVVSLKKTFSFLGISKTMKELFLKEFRKAKSDVKRRRALVLYSHMSGVEEFREAIVEYLPKAGTIDQEADSKFSAIQLYIPGLLMNLRPRWKNLDLISKFFIGDFLIAALPSFHACVFCTQVNKAVAFLKEQLKNLPFRVTFTKSVIRLMAEMSSRQEKIEFCLSCWQENKHYSIRTVLLSFVSKYFLELPTKEGFQVLEELILESDEHTIVGRPQIATFPREFFMDYVAALWKFSEKQPPREKTSLQVEILNDFNKKNIGFLSSDFSVSLIEANLFQPTLLNVEEFTAYYLISEPPRMGERVKMLLGCLNTSGLQSDSVSSFFKTMLDVSIQDSVSFSHVLEFLLANWPPSPAYVLYEERLMLNYYYLYHKVVRDLEDDQEKLQKISVEFGQELKNLYSRLTQAADVTLIVVESLKDFFKKLKTTPRPLDVVLVVRELVRNTEDRNLAIVGISVIPKEVALSYHEQDNTYDSLKTMRNKNLDEIIKILKSLNDNVVLVYLIRKFGFKVLEQKK